MAAQIEQVRLSRPIAPAAARQRLHRPGRRPATVFNAFLAIPAGFVNGARLAYQSADSARLRAATRQTCIITTIILALVCMASAFIALASPSTPADLEGMLGLPFTVTPAMLWGIILLGGLGLLVVNWLLTDFSVRFTCRFFERVP